MYIEMNSARWSKVFIVSSILEMVFLIIFSINVLITMEVKFNYSIAIACILGIISIITAVKGNILHIK